jgi:hypothetical protein
MKSPKEMSRTQFKAALAKYGFRQSLLWVSDTTGQVPGTSWGMILWGSGPRKGKVAYRATLAKVIRERDAEIAKREKGEAA